MHPQTSINNPIQLVEHAIPLFQQHLHDLHHQHTWTEIAQLTHFSYGTVYQYATNPPVNSNWATVAKITNYLGTLQATPTERQIYFDAITDVQKTVSAYLLQNFPARTTGNQPLIPENQIIHHASIERTRQRDDESNINPLWSLNFHKVLTLYHQLKTLPAQQTYTDNKQVIFDLLTRFFNKIKAQHLTYRDVHQLTGISLANLSRWYATLKRNDVNQVAQLNPRSFTAIQNFLKADS